MANLKDKFEIGLIGCGDMGKVYANHFTKSNWKVNVCDLPANTETLKQYYKSNPLITVMDDGFGVSRRSDFIIYSVEAALIERVVAKYGPATKVDAIVCGQTSVKEPEIKAFEAHIPKDCHIITCHSLHGPSVNPEGLPLVLINHKCTDEKFDVAKQVLESLNSKIVVLKDYKEHDRITADTQAVTHLAFLSMGTAWKRMQNFPWETPLYVGGIESIKILMALRIYSNKWHVYAGLAILNPSAHTQVAQYADSCSQLFCMMIQEKEAEFTKRIMEAREFVFGGEGNKRPLLLTDDLLQQYSLSSVIPASKRLPNSHLSLLAIVDCWKQMNINPYDHLICQTPPFRLLLGITEFLFRSPKLLQESIYTAIHSKGIRSDDMEFTTTVRGWQECIAEKSFDVYQSRFNDTADFFRGRMDDARELSAELIAGMSKKT